MGENKDVSQTNAGSQRGSRRTLIILGIVVGIVFVTMAAIIVALAFGRKNEIATAPGSSTPEQPKREVLVTEDNVQEVIEQMAEEEYVPFGSYTATMNFDWHFATGDAESYDSYVANDPENTNDVYFDIFLSDDRDNAIYESPIIPRGSEIRNIRLKTDLDAGTYDCILIYHLVDENQNSLSTASFALTITIEG